MTVSQLKPAGGKWVIHQLFIKLAAGVAGGRNKGIAFNDVLEKIDMLTKHLFDFFLSMTSFSN